MLNFIQGRQDGRVAIVTGANTGVGYETARQLYASGATVVLACRSQARGAEAIKKIESSCSAHGSAKPSGKLQVISCDLSNLKSVQQFVKQFQAQRLSLHYLVNNAGLNAKGNYTGPWTTEQGCEICFGANFLGHFALTQLLLPEIQRTSKTFSDCRIVILSSCVHWVAPTNFEWYLTPPFTATPGSTTEPCPRNFRNGYYISKLAQTMYGWELQRRLRQQGSTIKVLCVDPGFVDSSIWRQFTGIYGYLRFDVIRKCLALTPAQGARTSCEALTRSDLQGGEFLVPHAYSYYPRWCGGLLYLVYTAISKVTFGCTVQQPSRSSQDPVLAKRLWKLSSDFCQDEGIKLPEL